MTVLLALPLSSESPAGFLPKRSLRLNLRRSSCSLLTITSSLSSAKSSNSLSEDFSQLLLQSTGSASGCVSGSFSGDRGRTWSSCGRDSLSEQLQLEGVGSLARGHIWFQSSVQVTGLPSKERADG
jgi:hypothetical protein